MLFIHLPHPPHNLLSNYSKYFPIHYLFLQKDLNKENDTVFSKIFLHHVDKSSAQKYLRNLKKLGLKKLEARVLTENQNSLKLFQKNDFQIKMNQLEKKL